MVRYHKINSQEDEERKEREEKEKEDIEKLLIPIDRRYNEAHQRYLCAYYLWLTIAAAAFLFASITKQAGFIFWGILGVGAIVFRFQMHFDHQMRQIIREARPYRQRINAFDNSPPRYAPNPPPLGYIQNRYGDDLYQNLNTAPANIVSLQCEEQGEEEEEKEEEEEEF